MEDEAWSGERVDLLRRLWAEGATAAVIGVKLGGVSRSAVLGKIFRLRLRGESAVAAPPAGQKSATSAQGDGADTPARRRRRQPREQPPPAPVKIARYKTLLELTNHTCRWPHGRPGSGKFFFCGAVGADLEQGVPYCAAHMRRAYRTYSAASPVEHADPAGAPPISSVPSSHRQIFAALLANGRNRGPSPP